MRKAVFHLAAALALASATIVLALPSGASAAAEYSLEIYTYGGTGEGRVECKVYGIWEPECESYAEYPSGTSITLRPVPDTGSEFSGWTGGTGSAEICNEKGTGTCTFAIKAESYVEAPFKLIEYTLTVNFAGEGEGEVECEAEWAEPCESGVANAYPYGAEVILTPTAPEGSEFAGWSAGSGSASTCSGTEPCHFTITANSSVTATFDLEPSLEVEAGAGSGEGVVECEVESRREACEVEARYPKGTELTLIGKPELGSEFTGWSGGSGSAVGCTGTADCSFTIEANSAVMATFNLNSLPPPPTFNLKVAKAGSGSGTVTSSPVGVGCGSTCEHEFEEGKEVTLTATAASGSEFAGWTALAGSPGTCTGTTSPCEVTMNAAVELEATFNESPPPPTFNLEVVKGGPGKGTVRSSPRGIGCGTTCTASFPMGTTVTLSGTSATNSEPVRWSGCGSVDAEGGCVVEVSADKTVTATFDLIPRALSIAMAGTGTGTVQCRIDGGSLERCAGPYPSGDSVRLVAAAAAGSEFAGWSGGTGSATRCSGTGSCSFTIAADSSVIATFGVARPGVARVARKAIVKGRRALLKLSCSGGPCQGRLKLIAKVRKGRKVRRVVVGRASFSLVAGGRKKVGVPLSAAARRSLKGRRVLSARVTGPDVARGTVRLRRA
jgi:hypothetical protein